MIKRRLHYTCKEAKQPFYLLIFFKPTINNNRSKSKSTETSPPPELFKDVFPLAYEVIAFGDKTAEHSEEFEMKFSAFVDENNDGNSNEIIASAQRDVSEGQKVELVSSTALSTSSSNSFDCESDEEYASFVDAPVFTPPVNTGVFGDRSITIVNNSGHIQNVGIKVNGKSALLFERVGNQNQVIVRVEPKIYLTVLTTNNDEVVIRQDIKSDELTCIDLSRMLQNSIDIAIGQDWNGKWFIKYK